MNCGVFQKIGANACGVSATRGGIQTDIAKAQKVVEDSRRLIEENRIILEKAKRTTKL
jgi:hypothetical protein